MEIRLIRSTSKVCRNNSIKLSKKYLLKHLSKPRSPQKHDAANKELNKLLDTYVSKYLKINCR